MKYSTGDIVFFKSLSGNCIKKGRIERISSFNDNWNSITYTTYSVFCEDTNTRHRGLLENELMSVSEKVKKDIQNLLDNP